MISYLSPFPATFPLDLIENSILPLQTQKQWLASYLPERRACDVTKCRMQMRCDCMTESGFRRGQWTKIQRDVERRPDAMVVYNDSPLPTEKFARVKSMRRVASYISQI